MRNLMLSFLLLSYATNTDAQQLDSIPGVYSLQGVMETASGFKLDKDSTFEFYYSYGALDRYGSGTWSIRNNTVFLTSKPYPGRDFKLLNKTLTPKKGTTIKIAEKNPVFFQFVYCVLRTRHGDTLINANPRGEITLPTRTDTIKLLFELAPEKTSTFVVDSKKSNSFSFQFEPWIAEVFFTRFPLIYEQGQLVGKHPLLADKGYTYEKEN